MSDHVGRLRNTMLRSLALVVLVLAALDCRVRHNPPSHGLDGDVIAGEEACVDRWLASHSLDVFGSPKGTIYPGGSPVFDERTGRRISRIEYVYAQHPEAQRTCGSDR
jgi:hypothetical protein